MKNLSARIRKLIAQALNDYSMIQDGDRVLVGVSGGNILPIIRKNSTSATFLPSPTI